MKKGIFNKIKNGNSFEAAQASYELLNIIDQIQEIRTRNNKNWMDILKLAFKHAPDEAKKIMADITECDAEINKLTRELTKEK